MAMLGFLAKHKAQCVSSTILVRLPPPAPSNPRYSSFSSLSKLLAESALEANKLERRQIYLQNLQPFAKEA